MSKQSSKHRAIQPLVPNVSTGTWKALVAAADEFNRLAAWEWMHDSHVIGLKHPVTKEVLLGSILGRLRTVFALLVYRNDAGHRWLLTTILNEGDSGGFDLEDGAFEQDLVKAEFVLKGELTKEDKAVLAAAGFTPATKRGHVWPQFRSIVPGGYPWHLTQAEAETLLFALPRVAAVARLMRENPLMWDNHLEGEIAFVPENFNPTTEDLRAERIEWHPMIPPPELPPELVALDEKTVARMKKLTMAKGFYLELDVTYAPFPVASSERPHFPKLAMAVDRASGFIGGFHLSELSDRDGAAALGIVLRDALMQLGHRPESIRVQRPRVAAMLSDAAAKLGSPISLDLELPALNFARESMSERFRP